MGPPAGASSGSVADDPNPARTPTNLDLVSVRPVRVIRGLEPNRTADGTQVLGVELELASAAADLKARRNTSRPAEREVAHTTRDADDRAAGRARQPQVDLIDATSHLDPRQLEVTEIAIPMGDPAPNLDRPARRRAKPDVR